MGKLFARAVCSVLLFVPAISFALGLGPITMRSSLNQPLDAEIDIHSAQPGDLDGFAVRLASVEDFARVNVERSVFLTQIQFKLQVRGDGSAYIHLTTRQNVTEPYLDFLIEARWPRGRALKEYTVLVDPPVLTAETPAPVEQATTAPVFSEPAQPKVRRPAIRPAEPVEQPVEPFREEPVQQQQVAKRPPAPPVRREFPAEERVPEGDVDYGRVKRGDTLYEIARDTRPEGVSVNQMMLAYLRDNPEAFIGGNINRLKAGYVLRIKDASTIADVSKTTAASQVREQNLAWREGRSTRLVKQVEPEGGDERLSSLRDELSDTSPEAGEKESSAEPATKTEGPKVVLAKKASDAQEGSAGSSDKQDDEAGQVKEDLLVAGDELDKTQQETKLLDERMAELDEQLQSMQRLIMLKDEELLTLQNQQAGGKVDEAVTKAKEDAKKQAAAKKPEPEPKKEESLIPDELLSDPILLGLAGLLVVAVVGWLVVRRRRMHGGFEESILNVGAGGGAAVADEGGPESAMVSDFVMSDMPAGAQIDASEVDAISEADVYLAYGRHQQAEDILRQALDKAPNQLDLHAKMLEVYHAAKNADAFEEQARMLYEKIGGDTSNSYWSDIEPLGREICPHSELFGGGGGAAADMDMGGSDLGGVSADEEDLLDFDFNEDTGIDDLTAAGSDSGSDDGGLDFDMSSLDFDMDESSSEEAPAAPAMSMEAEESAIDFAEEPAAEADSGLDFDLSFGDDDAQSEPEESAIDMDMDTTELEADNSIDFDSGSFEMESDESISVEDDSPLELSMDDGDSSASEFSLEMDQGADIVQLDTGSDEIDLDGELDEDIFSNVDEVGTKLDLAKAYVDMGDSDGARSILDEVLEEGDDSQKQQAEELLQQMG